MAISVLMAVYHSERAEYLDAALFSIWDNQILKPDEIILVEDGPLSKELKDIIKKWKVRLCQKLTIVTNEVNIGLTKSLNKGLAFVTGDYIARMDSDDISMPERFQKQMEFFERHPDVDIVGGSLQEFDSTNDNLGIRHYPRTNEDVLKYIHKASPLPHPAVMMRRKIFESGLSYNEKYRTSQDIALWFNALTKGFRIANLDEIVLKFRRDGEVFKRRSKEKAKNEFEIYIKGIHNLYGLFSWRYVYPIARYLFRLLPIPMVKLIYGSNLRKRLLG